MTTSENFAIAEKICWVTKLCLRPMHFHIIQTSTTHKKHRATIHYWFRSWFKSYYTAFLHAKGWLRFLDNGQKYRVTLTLPYSHLLFRTLEARNTHNPNSLTLKYNSSLTWSDCFTTYFICQTSIVLVYINGVFHIRHWIMEWFARVEGFQTL